MTIEAKLAAIRERNDIGGPRTMQLGGDPNGKVWPAETWKICDSQADVAPLLEAVEAAYPTIRDMVDPDECWFDHGGGCQAHGYLSLEPGENCPQYDAKKWLEHLGGDDDEHP